MDGEAMEKNKRGRPKSTGRLKMEFMDPMVRVEGGDRTKVNFAYSTVGFDIFCKNPEAFRVVMGGSLEEFLRGEKNLPRGWRGAFEQVGRYLLAIDADEEQKSQIMGVVRQAREDGCTWTDIKMHFWRLRLGDREGGLAAVVSVLLRAIDGYQKTFPKTPRETIKEALRETEEILDLDD
jgi:hypothetical protein